MRRLSIVAPLFVGFVACGGEDAALAGRVAELERKLADAEAAQQRLLAVLREHGIVVHSAPPRDAAEAMARSLEDLEAALVRLQAAKDTQDQTKGQGAMAALEAALVALRQDRAAALPAVLAKAVAAPGPQQAAWLECAARIGGADAVPALRALAGDPSKAPELRVAATRALVGADAAAAIPAVSALLAEPTLPELYLLVHLLAASGVGDAAPVVIQALQHPDRSVRCHAATGLANFPMPAAVEALATAALGDEYPAVRINALRALARAASVERLRDVAGRVAGADTDPGVRTVARELSGR